MARWIASPDNPLTSRVLANRLWEKFFGVGLVKTSENFGVQAEWPSHPELLDWLATEMVAKKWDLKAFQKMIVMSAAYRQASSVTPELEERDPENRLVARGPRFRLSAEQIRDQALAVSGLLVVQTRRPRIPGWQDESAWGELAIALSLLTYAMAHYRLLALLRHPATRAYLFALCTLALFHGAHRFRYTLYDGLQIKHLNEVINVLCYGGAVVGSVAAAYLLWQGPS